MPPKKPAVPKIPRTTTIPANHRNVLEFFKDSCELNDETGVLETKVLYSIDKAGKYHYWQGFIGISPENNSDDLLEIGENHIIVREILDDNECGAIWTRFGQEGGKEQVSAKTWICEGKNAGKANFTTPLTQAILEMRTLYNKRIKKGDTESKDDLVKSGTKMTIESLISSGKQKAWRVFPMAVHDVAKANNWKHVKYPVDIQPKFDGTMYVVVYHDEIPDKIDGYSRRREDVEGQEKILEELKDILPIYQGLYLVGELWKAGKGRQDISGISRRQDNTGEQLDYMIFDCFTLNDDKTWEERKAVLDEIKELCEGDENCKHIKFAESYRVKDKAELLNKYEKFLAEGLEGGIIRNLDAKYVFSTSREYRTYEILKIKPRMDAEWPVVGFTQGTKGKEIGSIIWICDHEGKRFNVTPNNPVQMRQEKYKYLLDNPEIFEKKYKGQEMTISYDLLSNDGLPQECKALYFKDQKLEGDLRLEAEEYYKSVNAE